ncbi:hypothetical protein [Cyanobium sp. ULC082]
MGHTHLLGDQHHQLLQSNEAQPFGELAAKVKKARSAIAARDLRQEQPQELRQDAVSYCTRGVSSIVVPPKLIRERSAYRQGQ